ncbi:MAG: transposase [Anaerolineae bacterium]
MLKRHRNTPVHLFLDDAPYFITGAIYQKRPLLANPKIKARLLEFIQEHFRTYNWELHHWVMLDNHYHLLGKSRVGQDLTRIFQSTHSRAGILISQLTRCAKPVWWNYWDYCPRDEEDYMTRLNYLLMNPLKHGYVNNLHDYPFSSFHQIFAELGRERLAKQMQDYPGYKNLVLDEANEDDF